MLNGYRSTFSKTVTALMVLNHILGLNTYISGYVSNNRMFNGYKSTFSKTVTVLMVLNHILGLNTYISIL
jgi:hypothetical protein